MVRLGMQTLTVAAMALAGCLLASVATAQAPTPPSAQQKAAGEAALAYVEAINTPLNAPMFEPLFRWRSQLNGSPSAVRETISTARAQLTAAQRVLTERSIPTAAAPELDVGLSLQALRQRRAAMLARFEERFVVLETMQAARETPDCAAFSAAFATIEAAAWERPGTEYWQLSAALRSTVNAAIGVKGPDVPAPGIMAAPSQAEEDRRQANELADTVAPAFQCPALPIALTFEIEFRGDRRSFTRHLTSISDPAASEAVTAALNGAEVKHWLRGFLIFRSTPLRLRYSNGALTPLLQ